MIITASGANLAAAFNAAIRARGRDLAVIAGLSRSRGASRTRCSIRRPDTPGGGSYWADVGASLLMAGVVIGWGLFVRARRELVRSLRAQADRAADEARAAERRRIAREMHDVLAHRLSLLSVHAGALEFNPDAPAEEVAAAAGVIRESAHSALDELREVIGVLREDGGESLTQPPQPTLADLAALIEESRAAGMRITAAIELGDAAPPAAVGRTAYRIAQEGLTNARKHAPGAAVTLDGRRARRAGCTSRCAASRAVAVGAGPALPGAGTGLIGLAERVSLAGGELEHGVDPDGAFVLRARLPAMIRVLLVDDDALVRSGLRMMLAGAGEIEVVGEAADGREVLGAVDRHRPDVVLMDIRMPQLDGIAATRLLCRAPDPPAVLVLTTFDADELVLRALQAGAAGFLLKDTPPAEIVRAIELVHAGDGMLSPGVTRRLIALVAGDSDAGARDRRRARPDGHAQPARARRRAGRRPGSGQRRDRRRAAPLRADGEGPRLAAARQARCRQPRPDRPARAGRGRAVSSVCELHLWARSLGAGRWVTILSCALRAVRDVIVRGGGGRAGGRIVVARGAAYGT